MVEIAKALARNPRILILDEATSSLDYESERIIQQNMRQIASRRTVFVVAHRLSTVRAADLILVLKSGKLVDQGTHEELLETSSVYREIHASQLAEPDEVPAISEADGLFRADGLFAEKELVS